MLLKRIQYGQLLKYGISKILLIKPLQISSPVNTARLSLLLNQIAFPFFKLYFTGLKFEMIPRCGIPTIFSAGIASP